MQDVVAALTKLMDVRIEGGNSATLTVLDDGNEKLDCVLRQLEKHGMAICHVKGEEVSTWSVAGEVEHTLRPISFLHSPKRVVLADTTLALSDMTVVDLVPYLASLG